MLYLLFHQIHHINNKVSFLCLFWHLSEKKVFTRSESTDLMHKYLVISNSLKSYIKFLPLDFVGLSHGIPAMEEYKRRLPFANISINSGEI